jgi:cytochrome c oxidase cbb3-type subunit 4
MDLQQWIGSVLTVIAFAAFVGIVVWAYGRGRKRAFEEAANAPFALPDDEDAPQARGAAATPRARGDEGAPRARSNAGEGR